jgi:hypothetical protein
MPHDTVKLLLDTDAPANCQPPVACTGGDVTMPEDALILLLDADSRVPERCICQTVGEFMADKDLCVPRACLPDAAASPCDGSASGQQSAPPSPTCHLLLLAARMTGFGKVLH